jgi:choice-of-anchor A domain-containing protein
MRLTTKVLLLSMVGCILPAAQGSLLYTMDNVLVFGNFTSSNSDTGGSLAAGGTVNLTNYTVANNPLDGIGTYSLVGGTDVIANNGQAKSGSIYDPIAGGITSFTGTVVNSGPSPINFGTAQTSLVARSNQLAGLASTGSVSGTSTLTLTGAIAGMNIFNVTASQLAGSVTVNITVPNGATAIINVAGTGAASTTTAQISFNGHTVNGDATDASVRNLLFNYYQASSVTLSGGIIGSILAPNAAVTAGFTQFDGQLIAQSFNGNTEFHSFVFNGQLPSSGAPEPGTCLMTGLGLLLVTRVSGRFAIPGR